MLCSLVYAELTAAPFTSLITAAPHHYENSGRRCAQRPAFHLPLSTANRLTPVESADPKNGRVTPLQSADLKTKHLKSFRIRRSEKRWGRVEIVNWPGVHTATPHFDRDVPRPAPLARTLAAV